MKKLSFILFFLVPLLGLAQTDTLQVASRQFSVEIKEDIQDKHADLVFSNLATSENKIFRLRKASRNTLLFGKGIANAQTWQDSLLLSTQDSTELKSLYVWMGCTDSEISAKFVDPNKQAELGSHAIQHLVNKVATTESKKRTIFIHPQQKDGFVVDESAAVIPIWLYGLLGLLALTTLIFAYLFVMEKKKSGSEEASAAEKEMKKVKTLLKDIKNHLENEGVILQGKTSEDTIKELYQFYWNWFDAKSAFDKQQVDFQELNDKYTAVENELKTKEQAQKQQENQYFTQLYEVYLKPFDTHFDKSTPYPPDAATKRIFIENLVPLALHFASFIRYKLKIADASDKENVAAFDPTLRANLSQSLSPETIGFDVKLSQANHLLLNLIDLLKAYEATELRNVVVKEKRIKNG